MYVQRNDNGDIVGVYAALQPDIAEEFIDESSPELAAFYEKASEAHLNE
jgi:hypothetical protein